MAMIEMSVQNWIDVKDNPRQRNTAKRAKIASKKHLSQYQKPHRVVFAASKSGEVICKIDGHTRALLWKEGMLDTPPSGKVEVVLFEVSGLAEAKLLYDMLDCKATMKTPSDNIYGACRELGFELNSYLLRNCAFVTQLKLATTGKKYRGEVHAMVKNWKAELMMLDSLALSSHNTILISVMLTAIRRDGLEKCAGFFSKLDRNEGLKLTAGYDGVELLSRVMTVRRAEGRTAGYENLVQVCGQAWSAYEMWLTGKTRKAANLPIADFTKVVVSLNEVNATQ